MPLPSLRAITAGLWILAALPYSALQASQFPASKPIADPIQTHPSLPAERINNTISAYNGWLDTVDQRHATAGLATALIVNDRVVLERALGYANAATHEPVTPQTVFRLASLSKAFASALAGLLIQDGRFRWDTHLANAVPGFQLHTAEATNNATVADILGQRTGLPRNTYDNLLEAGYAYPDLVNRLSQVPLRCPIGRCYSYQNIAYSLIGNVVQNKTGEPFTAEVQQRLFRPLGMNHASYGLQSLESSASWARPHRRSANGWRPYLPNANYYHVAPAAGVNASLRDMEQWLISQMGGRPNVLSPGLLQTLHTPGIATPSELRATPWRHNRLSRASYALGWRVFTYAGQTMIYHAGEVDGYRTMIGFLPKYHAGMVALWNSSSPLPFGLMPMVMDHLLGLDHHDWAGVEKAYQPARTIARTRRQAPTNVNRRQARASSTKAHRPTSHARKVVAKTKARKRPAHRTIHTASAKTPRHSMARRTDSKD